MIYIISGDGIGAGKTRLARKLVGDISVISLAYGIRVALDNSYPGYPWFSAKQADKLVVCAETGLTLRQMMIDYGQGKCEKDPCYWAKDWGGWHNPTRPALAVDDIRKIVEAEYFKLKAPHCLHFHIRWDKAIAEPQYENDKLAEMADYIVARRE